MIEQKKPRITRGFSGTAFYSCLVAEVEPAAYTVSRGIVTPFAAQTNVDVFRNAVQEAETERCVVAAIAVVDVVNATVDLNLVRRCIAQANAQATEGENNAKVTVANSDSARRQQEAEAERAAIAAERVSQARAAEESYRAEQQSEHERAERERATEYANVVVPAEIERDRITTLAEAEAEQVRRIKQGEADGLRAVMEAEAAGYLASLTQRAEGLGSMMDKAGGSAELAALMMIVDQMPKLVEEQVKAIANLQIDTITVWDSGGGSGNGNGSQTANFLSGLMGSLPPMHELAANVGIRLPEFLGEVDEGEALPPKLRKLADKIDEAEAGEPGATSESSDTGDADNPPKPSWES